MRIGCCIPAAHAPVAAEIGYDFVELRATELFPEEPLEQFRETQRHIESAGIPALSYNFLLPRTLKVVGPEIDAGRQRRYMAVAAERAASLGGQVMVFGSGGARWIPDGYPLAAATQQFLDFARIAGEEADRRGLKIALEPLNHTEANLMHRVEEAVTYCRALEHPAVGLLADIYHMEMEGEPYHHLHLAGDRLLHVHVCDAGRACPGTRNFDLWGFCTYLNAVGYRGAISAECAFTRFSQEGPEVLNFLRDVTQARGELGFSL